MSKSSSSSSGIGIFGLTFIVFLVLKLAEIGVVAHWSWWWVTAPLWMPTCLVIAILIGYVIVIIVRYFARKKKYKKFNN